jgi:sensor histidine kinase YesM
MKKSTIVKLHLFFWGIFILTSASRYLIPIISPKEYSILLVIAGMGSPLFFYLAYTQIFKILKNKKLLFSALFSIVLLTSLCYLVDKKVFAYSSILILGIFKWLIYGSLFRFFIDWINKDQLQLQLSRQNLKSELALLRNQINPHFLFNSIHNIDTLISTNPAKASDSLIKLSDMMRYSFNEADAEFTDLSGEIEYIRKYLSLQELRITNSELVDFSVKGDLENIKIAPMLFIPFIENAFKHITDKEEKGGISIRFNITREHVYFEVDNIFDAAKDITKDSSSGIGLANVTRRLNLIYPDRHKLKITKENGHYKTELTVDINAS